MNQWSTEVNKKAYETIAGRPLNESKPGLKGLVRRNLCRWSNLQRLPDFWFTVWITFDLSPGDEGTSFFRSEYVWRSGNWRLYSALSHMTDLNALGNTWKNTGLLDKYLYALFPLISSWAQACGRLHRLHEAREGDRRQLHLPQGVLGFEAVQLHQHSHGPSLLDRPQGQRS